MDSQKEGAEAMNGNEQNLYRDVLMLGGQGWQRAEFVQGCTYAGRSGMATSSITNKLLK